MKYDEYKKEFQKLVNYYDYKYRKWEIFTDFCNIFAISLYQVFANKEELEKEYFSIIKKYDDVIIKEVFPKMASFLINGLSSSFGDFLGECFMELDLGSKYKGQFFTPYHLSKLMAQIVGTNQKQEIETYYEPTCGSSGMIIARADILQEQGINYQNKMLVQAVDIDKLCFYMSYIQLTLLHIPAEIIHGNSLNDEIFDKWYTPAYLMKAYKFNSIINQIEVPLNNVNDEFIETEKETFSYSQEQIKIFERGSLF